MRRLRSALSVFLLSLLAACGTADDSDESSCPGSGCDESPSPGFSHWLAFETIAPGEVSERIIEIRPMSDKTTDIGGLSLNTPPFSSDVAIDETIGPHEGRVATIRFAPEAAGSYEASVVISPEHGSMRITGTAIVPEPLNCITTTLDFGTLTFPRDRYVEAIKCTNDNQIDRPLRARWVEDVPGISVEGTIWQEQILIPPGRSVQIPIAVSLHHLPDGPFHAALLLELQGAEPVEVEVKGCNAWRSDEACDPPATD